MGNLYVDKTGYSNEKELFKRACDAEFERIQKLRKVVVDRDFNKKDIYKINKQSKILRILAIVFTLIALLILFLFQQVIIGGVVLLVSVLLFIFGSHRQPVVDAIYVQNIIIPKMEKLFPNYEHITSMSDVGTFCSSAKEFAPYYGRNRRRLNVLQNLGIINRDRIDDVTNILIMDNDEREAEMFSLWSYHQTQDIDDDRYRITTFKGTVIAQEYPFNIGGTVRVISTYKSNSGKEVEFINLKCALTPEKVETGNNEFNDNFEVYASSKDIVHNLLDENATNKLLWLKKTFGNFAMAITNNGIYLSFEEFDKFIKLPKTLDEVNDEAFEEIKDSEQRMESMMKDVINSLAKKSEPQETKPVEKITKIKLNLK